MTADLNTSSSSSSSSTHIKLSKKAIVVSVYNAMSTTEPAPTRKALIEAFMQQADVSQNCASTYLSNITSGKWETSGEPIARKPKEKKEKKEKKAPKAAPEVVREPQQFSAEAVTAINAVFASDVIDFAEVGANYDELPDFVDFVDGEGNPIISADIRAQLVTTFTERLLLVEGDDVEDSTLWELLISAYEEGELPSY